MYIRFFLEDLTIEFISELNTVYAWKQRLRWLCRKCIYIYIDDVHTHVNVNICTLPLASKAKAPNYTARTRTARASLCPSTIPSGTGWQLAWVKAARRAAAAQKARSLRTTSLRCLWRLRQRWKTGSFGSLCRGTLARQSQGCRVGPRRTTCRIARQNPGAFACKSAWMRI